MSILLENILHLITSKFPTDKEFEEQFEISRSTVSSWRKGKLKSYEKMAPKLASFFGVSVDELLGNGQKNKPAAQSDGQDPKDAEIISKLDVLNAGNRDAVLALIDSLLKSQ